MISGSVSDGEKKFRSLSWVKAGFSAVGTAGKIVLYKYSLKIDTILENLTMKQDASRIKKEMLMYHVEKTLIASWIGNCHFLGDLFYVRIFYNRVEKNKIPKWRCYKINLGQFNLDVWWKSAEKGKVYLKPWRFYNASLCWYV